ncbi:MAG: transglutaminase-like domain-containing protein [Myxococcota bacterium]
MDAARATTSSSAPAALTAQFLSAIPVTGSAAALDAARGALSRSDGSAGSDLWLELSVGSSERRMFSLLAERLPRLAAKDSRVRLPFSIPSATAKSADLRRLKQASFVIDFDAPTFKPFAATFDAEVHVRADLFATEKFVSEYISRKTYTRGFDIASEVASSRAGDCTEHAVLLAAALRRQGVSARVVFGIVLVIGERMAAFGHAWVEAVQGRAFTRLDAALYGLTEKHKIAVHYVPLAPLADEGVGFSRALREQPSTWDVRDVTLLLASEK